LPGFPFPPACSIFPSRRSGPRFRDQSKPPLLFWFLYPFLPSFSPPRQMSPSLPMSWGVLVLMRKEGLEYGLYFFSFLDRFCQEVQSSFPFHSPPALVSPPIRVVVLSDPRFHGLSLLPFFLMGHMKTFPFFYKIEVLVFPLLSFTDLSPRHVLFFPVFPFCPGMRLFFVRTENSLC